MSSKLSRRDFLKGSAAGVVGLASMGLLSACGADKGAEATPTPAAETTPVAEPMAQTIEAPAFPFEWHQVDVDAIQERVYKGFYDLGGCARAVFDGILGTLADEYGYPYNQVPSEMFANGHSGYTIGSLCGSLGGACGILGLFVPTEDVDTLVKELEAWYSAATLPIYQPDQPLVTTVANSVNCVDSLGLWMKTAGVEERSDPLRKSRCAGVSADVAKKTVELLDVYYGFAEAAPVVEDNIECGENQYIGKGEGYGGEVVVRVTMDGDKIGNVEILKHQETPNVGTNAIDGLPEQFKGLATADEVDALDAVSGATVTSKALKEAVKAALAQVK